MKFIILTLLLMTFTSQLVFASQFVQTNYEIPTKRSSENCPFVGVNKIHITFSEQRLEKSRGRLILNAIREDNRVTQVGSFVIQKNTDQRKLTFNVGGCATEIQAILEFADSE